MIVTINANDRIAKKAKIVARFKKKSIKSFGKTGVVTVFVSNPNEQKKRSEVRKDDT